MGGRDFVGTERFEVLSRLGSGGMGAVYHVLDREQGTRVALKTVGLVEGEALLRFKREFRALQDLDHPNLIRLGELFEVNGEWFYTMELVDGTDFLRHVRMPVSFAAGRDGDRGSPIGSDARRALEAADEVLTALPKAAAADETPSWDKGPSHAFDEVRLRRSLAQLAQGLTALHRASKVHRDIKPNNVLVTPEGRVVILDFGLVTDVRAGVQQSDVGIMGTYPYMSPEQTAGLPVDGRTDWYAVGVMLFQALTGRLPFRGTTAAMIVAKMNEEAPDPRQLARHVPNDLAELCRDLLRRRPEDRPTAADILTRLHVEAESDGWGGPPSTRSQSTSSCFVGRAEELAKLEVALDHAVEQRPRLLVLTGESGIGKSELVKRFLERAAHRRVGLVVLHGRCYERESVPFRSVDGLVDALSGHLARLSEDQVHRLVPRHADILVHAFPVLKRVDAFQGVSRDDVRDPQEQRARLFGALRTLFVKLAALETVVAVVEDLQWMDEDSRSLLGELLREPSGPTMLFVGTLRTAGEEADRRRAVAHAFTGLSPEVIHLEALSEEDATTLAESLLREETGDRPARIAEIVRESKGHPLFVDELARHAGVHRQERGYVHRLDEAIRVRVSNVDEQGRKLLRLVALAGGPVAQSVIARASQLPADELHRSLSTLRALRLIRAVIARQGDFVEPYHARIAEAVLADETEEGRRQLHERIARALEASGDGDLVDLATHWAGAGEKRRAASYAARAAQRAADVLAFDRAATLYETSLSLDPTDVDELAGRRVKLARALANAGRGERAGEMYLSAVEGAPPAEAIDLRRRAAEQFLLSGHVARGIESFRQVLASVGIRYPSGLLAAIGTLIWTRFVLAIRGLRFDPIDESMVAPAERLRVDTCHSAALGLVPTDTIRGLAFYARAMHLALMLGEPGRIACELSVEAFNLIAGSGKKTPRTYKMLQQARDLAEQAKSAQARGVVTYAEGMGHYMLGQWSEAVDAMLRAEEIFRDECAEAPSELRTMQACVVHCYWELGEWQKLQHRTSRALKEAEERGDLFTMATIRSGLSIQAHCMRDETELGLQKADETIAGWTGTSFDVQRYMYHVQSAFGLAYLGDVAMAHERVEVAVVKSRSSMLAWVQLMRAGLYQARGLFALARAAKEPANRASLIKRALADAKRLEREGQAWTKAGAAVLRANAEALRGRRAESLSWFDLAIEECDRARMTGRAMAARWAKGAIVGGREGELMIGTARKFLEEQEIVDPARLVRNLAPVLFVEDPASLFARG